VRLGPSVTTKDEVWKIMGSVRQKIGIFGNFGGGNLGNEGSLEAMMGLLAAIKAGCRADLPLPFASLPVGIALQLCPIMPRAASSIAAKLKGRFQDLQLAFNGTRGIDVMIIPGTGILDDFGESPQGPRSARRSSGCASSRR
jgi:polysaccharide pyruvyl transferase WcaK-like protein